MATLSHPPTLLTDPFLQLPTADGVRVVWFTEFAGIRHHVNFGDKFSCESQAITTPLSRMAEDAESHLAAQGEDGSSLAGWTPRAVWRHEASLSGLAPGRRVPYRVTSVRSDGADVTSRGFSLAPLPTAGQRLRILLTSDHQLMPMTPANLQMVDETIGRVDAVFHVGDLQNVPDRASEWFDDRRGCAFFPAMQGRAASTLARTGGLGPAPSVTYHGGEIIQHAPLFTVIGNHDVMGRFRPEAGLNGMFHDARPHRVAEAAYEAEAHNINAQRDPGIRAAWIRDNSFNTVTYEELFTLPSDGPAGQRYYALRFGDVHLIGLFATRIWRPASLAPEVRGKYREADQDLLNADAWGWGEFIFDDLSAGSTQYEWLADQLVSHAFRSAPYKVVMMHHPSHGLGENSNPAFAHPVQSIDRDNAGRIAAVRYEYPIASDVIVRDVEPLLRAAGVQLVITGHSHVWYRLGGPAGINFLETSNVGNTYGCFLPGHCQRGNAPDDPQYDSNNYRTSGDPHGLNPVVPSEFAPIQAADGTHMPCVASNELTVFSILDTGDGTVSSYVYDTREPDRGVKVFDRFVIGER